MSVLGQTGFPQYALCHFLGVRDFGLQNAKVTKVTSKRVYSQRKKQKKR